MYLQNLRASGVEEVVERVENEANASVIPDEKQRDLHGGTVERWQWTATTDTGHNEKCETTQ